MVAVVPKQLVVDPDSFEISKDPVLLVAHLRAGVAINLYDDTQGVGGLLHLRYVATLDNRPLELTENTLSSSVLLIDRFCKEMKAAGSRAQWWRVRIVAHLAASDMDVAAATVLDLVQAYFNDSAKPITCQQIKHAAGITVRMHAREGQIWTSGYFEEDFRTQARAG